MIVTKLDGVVFDGVTYEKQGDQHVCRICRDSIPAKEGLLTLDLRAFDAVAGDPGYYVLPDAKANFITQFTHREDTQFRLRGCLMPMLGVKLADRGVLAVVEGMSFNYGAYVCVSGGKYSLQLRWDLSSNALYEDIVIRLITLPNANATYVDIARCYREYAVGRKGLRPLAERVKTEPVLEYGLSNMPIIRIRMGWKPAPSPVADQTPETEPPMHVACSFRDVEHLIDEMKRQGIEKAELCLVGWNIRGHDGRWPQTFPVEPALGGEEGLRHLIAHADAAGYRMTCHTNSSEAYTVAESFDREELVRRKNGQVSVNTDVWSGGRAYHLCPRVACEKYLPHTLARLKDMGFRGFHYIDVLSVASPKNCYHPDHPSDAGQSAGYVRSMLQQAASVMGGAGSEGSFDFALPGLDFGLYVGFNTLSGLPEIADEVIPLWQLVYHGYALSNPSAETVNFMIKKPQNRLRFYEYGGFPVLYYFTCFVGSDALVGNWMGDEDIYCDTDDHRRKSVSQLKAMLEEYKAYSHLQTAFMNDHRKLAEGVYETCYSEGSRVVVNYTAAPYSHNGRVVPANDLLLYRP